MKLHVRKKAKTLSADLKEANAERAAVAVSMFEGDAPEEFTAPETDGEEEAPAAKSEEE